MTWRSAIQATRVTAVNVLIPVGAVAAALATITVLLVATGVDAVAAFRSMGSAAFGGPFSLSTTLIKAMPRLFAALGIALALRAGLWNIGAEGQLHLGAIAATAVGLFGPDLGPASTVLALVVGTLAGAVWGLVPGVLRAARGISEVITSLMLVYIAIQLTNYLTEGPWLQPGQTFPASPLLPEDQRLPIVWPRTLLNAGAVIAVAAVVAAWFLTSRTSFGLRLRAVGGNERAARFAGVPVPSVIVLAMAVSGAFAGLGGSVEVLGVRGRLIEGFSPGYGFEAIAIALLGRLQPVGILGAAILFGALDAGGAGLQTSARGVPFSVVQIAEGLAVVFVLIGRGVRLLVLRRRRARAALEAARRQEGLEPGYAPLEQPSALE